MENAQKWLTDKVDGDWLDKDSIIEITLFECVIHYIENESPVTENSVDWLDRILEIYNYIKFVRPLLIEYYNNISSIAAEILKKVIDDKDTIAMVDIIKYRGHLWS